MMKDMVIKTKNPIIKKYLCKGRKYYDIQEFDFKEL